MSTANQNKGYTSFTQMVDDQLQLISTFETANDYIDKQLARLQTQLETETLSLREPDYKDSPKFENFRFSCKALSAEIRKTLSDGEAMIAQVVGKRRILTAGTKTSPSKIEYSEFLSGYTGFDKDQPIDLAKEVVRLQRYQLDLVDQVLFLIESDLKTQQKRLIEIRSNLVSFTKAG